MVFEWFCTSVWPYRGREERRPCPADLRSLAGEKADFAARPLPEVDIELARPAPRAGKSSASIPLGACWILSAKTLGSGTAFKLPSARRAALVRTNLPQPTCRRLSRSTR